MLKVSSDGRKIDVFWFSFYTCCVGTGIFVSEPYKYKCQQYQKSGLGYSQVNLGSTKLFNLVGLAHAINKGRFNKQMSVLFKIL